MLLGLLVLAILVGTRQLITGDLPAIGQLAPFPNPLTLLTNYVDGWRTTGLGSGAAAPPLFGLLGTAGLLLLGGVDILQKILVLGVWPVAAVGAWRFGRHLGSTLARLVVVIAYLAVPLPYNALARGRWGAMLVYAATPWLLTSLVRVTHLAPFGDDDPRPLWRHMVALGAGVAVLSAFVPGAALVVVVVAVGLLLGSLVAGRGLAEATEAVVLAIGAAAVAAVLLLPWSLDLLLPGGWSTVVGVARLPADQPGLGALLRFQVGPLGAAPLGWALLVVAALPLILGHDWRLGWAVRLWMVALTCIGVAWAAGQGWLPFTLQSPDVLLAPAAMALAVSAALGAAAFETDLRGYKFGWRQAASLGVGATLVAVTLPVFSALPDGRWHLPATGVADSVAWMEPEADKGAFRVLWLGDPNTLPLDSWPYEEGLGYATSRDGPPDATDLLPGPPSDASESIAQVLRVAQSGGTARLGRLLAPMGIRYIVVPGPEAPGRLGPARRHAPLRPGQGARVPARPEAPAGRRLARGVREHRLGTGPRAGAGRRGPGQGPRVARGRCRPGRCGGRASRRRTGPLRRAHPRSRHRARGREPVAPVGALGRWRRGRPQRRLRRGQRLPGRPGGRGPSPLPHAAPALRAGARPPRPVGRARPLPLPLPPADARLPPGGRVSSKQRVPALAVIVLLLVGGALLDRWARDSSADETGSTGQEVGTEDVSWPVAAPASARSSAWFCAGATSAPGGAADGTVVIANAGDRALVASVTSIPLTGEGKQATVSVPASGRASQRLVDLANAPFAGAIVELDGGEAVVELVATGPLGTSVTACASSASPTWYFAEGVTTRDAAEWLTVLNPFPEDAVVDLSFTTEEGLVTPQELTGLSVRGRGMQAIDVGKYVQRREAVSTKVAARTGRLVVARLQTFDGSVGRKGMAITLGAATPGPLWYFADGLVTEGLEERFQVYNPQTVEAEVELAIDLDDGEAEPLRITVPRESRTSVVANEETRIPKGVGHAVTARSTNGVDVVVERSIEGRAPSTRLGFGAAPGARPSPPDGPSPPARPTTPPRSSSCSRTPARPRRASPSPSSSTAAPSRCRGSRRWTSPPRPGRSSGWPTT